MSVTQRKVIHFVRHAEGEHNVAGRMPGGYLREDLEDAMLTDHGATQCRELHARIFHWNIPSVDDDIASASQFDKDHHLKQHPHHPARAKLLVVSPLNRTLATASHSFRWLQGRIPWVALECIRETSGLHPCDRRKHISTHKDGYPHVLFDHIEHEQDVLYPKFTTQREPFEHVVSRGNEFIQWLKGRDEDNIIVVTHSSFLQYFFIGCAGVKEEDYVWYENCELRSYYYELEGDAPVFEPVDTAHVEAEGHKNWLQSHTTRSS